MILYGSCIWETAAKQICGRKRHIANVPGVNPERAHLVCLLMHKQLKVIIVCPVQIGHGTALYASMVASLSKITGVLFQCYILKKYLKTIQYFKRPISGL